MLTCYGYHRIVTGEIAKPRQNLLSYNWVQDIQGQGRISDTERTFDSSAVHGHVDVLINDTVSVDDIRHFFDTKVAAVFVC